MKRKSKNILLVIVILIILVIAAFGYRYSLKHGTDIIQTTPHKSVTTSVNEDGFGSGTKVTAAPGTFSTNFPKQLAYPQAKIYNSYDIDFDKYTESTTVMVSLDTVANIDAYYAPRLQNTMYKLIDNNKTASPVVLDATTNGGLTRVSVQITDNCGDHKLRHANSLGLKIFV